jgi:hypothetical protein
MQLIPEIKKEVKTDFIFYNAGHLPAGMQRIYANRLVLKNICHYMEKQIMFSVVNYKRIVLRKVKKYMQRKNSICVRHVINCCYIALG